MAATGAGFGLFQTPNNRTMIAAAPRERSGGASGMLGTAGFWDRLPAPRWSHDQIRTNLHRALDS
jgi:hypothetical protein